MTNEKCLVWISHFHNYRWDLSELPDLYSKFPSLARGPISVHINWTSDVKAQQDQIRVKVMMQNKH